MGGPMMPGPGGQMPPPWPPMPPSPPPHGNRRLIWVLLGLVCVLTVTAVVLTVTLVGRDRHEPARSSAIASSATSGDKPPLPVSALDGLLPAKDVVRDAVSDPGIGLVNDGAAIDTDVMVDADCQGIASVAGPVYAGSGWTAIRWQRWNSPAEPDPPEWVHEVLMSVATYPQAEAARTFYTKQSAAWHKCSGRNINFRISAVKDAPDQFWSVGVITDADGVLKTTLTREGGGGWSCQHTLNVRNNIVVRISVCGFTDSAAAAQTLLDSVNQKIDAAA
ncbi:sensor domain-containing protein [Mycolicibacter terrae]|uniref:Sensor domain-containing protein n=2 Tax=Mycolicibacter terrae TaxID=1788 RepID=A0ACD2EMM8_9MYCO|nr:sensor domain-containing protein [Mycolicibacter terrae]